MGKKKDKEKKQKINSALEEYLKYKGLSKQDRKDCKGLLHNMIDQYEDIKAQIEAEENEEEEMELTFCYGCSYMSYDQPAGFTAEPRFYCSLHDKDTHPLFLCSWGMPAPDEEDVPYVPRENITADISLDHTCHQDLRYWY